MGRGNVLGGLAALITLAASASTVNGHVAEARGLRAPMAGVANALGMEQFGCQPVAEQADWAKGLMKVVDVQNRVYWRWVNGGEDVYFLGEAFLVNQILWRFSQVEAARHRVIVLPTQGRTRTFDGAEIGYDWHLHIPGSIQLSVLRSELEEDDPRLCAWMTVHVAGNVKLEELELPDGVEARTLDAVVDDLLEAAKDTDDFRRAVAISELGSFAEVPECTERILTALTDEAAQVRDTAIRALGLLGPLARPYEAQITKAALAAPEADRTRIEAALERVLGNAQRAELVNLRAAVERKFGS